MLCENLYSRPFFALISAKLISAKNLPIYSSLSLNIKTKVAWHDPVLPQEYELGSLPCQSSSLSPVMSRIQELSFVTATNSAVFDSTILAMF